MLQFLQRIGKALMLPIAVLPAAGLLLRLGQPDVFDIPVMAQAGAAVSVLESQGELILT
ncbi:hypothetical protein ACT453_39660, partial [Bacillus sp. D-CC]